MDIEMKKILDEQMRAIVGDAESICTPACTDRIKALTDERDAAVADNASLHSKLSSANALLALAEQDEAKIAGLMAELTRLREIERLATKLTDKTLDFAATHDTFQALVASLSPHADAPQNPTPNQDAKP